MSVSRQLRRAGRGASVEEIEAVYRRQFERFATVATAIVGSQAGARDAVQDAFALALRRRRQFRADGSLEGWLWQTVVNEARSQRRRARARASVEARALDDVWSDFTADTIARDTAERAALAVVIESLPERQRLVVFLRYYADLSYDQIAETLAVRPGTVAATLNAAHRTLRRRLLEVI
jgi:RNA polymerase sigma-70 factor (ECF subfamily)